MYPEDINERLSTSVHFFNPLIYIFSHVHQWNYFLFFESIPTLQHSGYISYQQVEKISEVLKSTSGSL